MWVLSVYILISVTSLVRSADNVVQVQTPLGTVIGFSQTSNRGRPYEVYQGIPYAKPPVGDLRFEEPVPITPWGTWNATSTRPICSQYLDKAPDKQGNPVPLKDRLSGEDDCLYLSIQVPALHDRTKKLPVIFYIHGGSFQFGSGAPTTTKFKFLADKDLVFVSMNYRVGIQGFLSTEDEVLPGNLGLKDQSLALRWTSENIAYFGGDPNRVTLIGCSAGGSSVYYHLLSPLSRGLFHSAVASSGTAFNPWAFTSNASEKAKRLGSLLNCPTQNSRQMVDCLKKVPALELAGMTREFQFWQYMPNSPFAPVVEKVGSRPFISKSPKQILLDKEVNDVPIIFSTDINEGCDPIAAYAPHENVIKDLNDNWLAIAPHLLNYNYTLPVSIHKEVAKAVRQEYFGDKPINNDTVRQLMQLITDEHYHIYIDMGLRLYAAASKSPVYFYLNTFTGSQSYSQALSGTKTIGGTCHCDELLLIVGNAIIDPTKTNEEMQMSDFFVNIWNSMTANRTIPDIGTTWQQVNPTESKTSYLQIFAPGVYSMRSRENFGNKNFWSKYLHELELPN